MCMCVCDRQTSIVDFTIAELPIDIILYYIYILLLHDYTQTRLKAFKHHQNGTLDTNTHSHTHIAHSHNIST